MDPLIEHSNTMSDISHLPNPLTNDVDVLTIPIVIFTYTNSKNKTFYSFTDISNSDTTKLLSISTNQMIFLDIPNKDQIFPLGNINTVNSYTNPTIISTTDPSSYL